MSDLKSDEKIVLWLLGISFILGLVAGWYLNKIL